MQTIVSRFLMGAVLVIMTLGTFAFAATAQAAAPGSAHAGMMDDMPAAERMACSQQGCAPMHQACDTHCVDQQQESHVSAVFHSAFEFPSLDAPAHPTFRPPGLRAFHRPFADRAPPALAFLRSVIKRE